MKVFYAECVYSQEEIEAVMEVLNTSRHALMDGKAVRAFESECPKQFQKNYGLMVNSGSSANLLALASLQLPQGSEVITPALTFSTTVAPIVQLGLKPVFVDVDVETLQASPQLIINAISPRTSAVMIPNLIGNVADWKAIHSAVKNINPNILLIEDSADTIGYTLDAETGNPYSDVTTTSFYASHIITGAGFGGFVSFKDANYYEHARLLRGWGRRSAVFGEDEDVEKRFGELIDGIPYDAKYIFDEMGYNFLPSEISAAFANIQLAKLKTNIEIRNKNFSYLKEFVDNSFGHLFQTFSNYKGVVTPWLAFPIVIRNSDHDRSKLQIELENRGIQTRTIFTGNILRQPVAKKYNLKSDSEFPNSDFVMRGGILLGCHHGLTLEKVKLICSALSDSVENLGW